jgi:hypothetical protein
MKKLLLAFSVVLPMFVAGCGAGDSTANNGQSISVVGQPTGCTPITNCAINIQYSTGGVGGLGISCTYVDRHFANFQIDFSACANPNTTPPGGSQQCQVTVSNATPSGQTGQISCHLLNGNNSIASTAAVSVSN